MAGAVGHSDLWNELAKHNFTIVTNKKHIFPNFLQYHLEIDP
jgi:hypothetical protein